MADQQVTRYTLQFDADTRKLLQSLSQVERAATDTEKSVKSLRQMTKESFGGFGLGDVAQIAAGAKLITSSVQAYGSLINVQQTAVQVFGEGFGEISKFAKQAADDVGLSERAAIELTTKIAGLGKAAGVSSENLAEFSTSLVRLGADLGAAFNTSTTRAVEAMLSAMSGSSIEPLREYNIVLNDKILKDELQILTGEKVIGVMNQQQRTLAVYSKLIKSTTDYHGQFDREAAGLLGTQQRLSASIENTAASLGQTFAPAAQTALDTTLSLVTGFGELNEKLVGIPAALVGMGAGLLALRPLTTRVSTFNKALIDGGKAGSVLQLGVSAVNPALVTMTGLMALSTTLLAQSAKGTKTMADGLQAMAAAGTDANEQLEGFDEFLTGVAQDAGGRWSQIFGGGAVNVDKFFGDLEADGEDVRKKFKELAAESPRNALMLLEMAKASEDVRLTMRQYGLSLRFMTTVTNEAIVADHNKTITTEALDAAYAAVEKDLGLYNEELEKNKDRTKQTVRAGEEFVQEMNDIMKAIEEATETSQELRKTWAELESTRLERTAEAFGQLFAGDTGLDTLANLRQINTAIGSLEELEGVVPSIADILNPENELAGTFSDVMQQLQDFLGPELQQAFEQGGEGALLSAGEHWREVLTNAFIQAGFDPTIAAQIMEQLGLTGEQLHATATLSLEASISEEAQQLLDLALGRDVISLDEYLAFKAALDTEGIDPAQVQNAIFAKFSDEGIKLPASVSDDVDFSDAEAFMEAQDIPFKAHGVIDGKAEAEKIEDDINRQKPTVNVMVKANLEDLNRQLRAPRSVTVNVVGGGGGVIQMSAPTAPAAPAPRVTNYFTIPTADPSAHMRAVQRWSRLNGQPMPQMTRGR